MEDRQKDELRSWAVGKGVGSHRRTCPVCSADRTKKKIQCLVVTHDGEKIMWHCWHCDDSGAMRAERRDEPSSKPNFWEAYKPEPVKQGPRNKAVKFIGQSLDAMAKLFLRHRGISENTATLYGCAAALAYFPDLRRETPAIAFVYDPAKREPSHKVRSTEEKAHVVDHQLSSLFGLQLVDMVESKDFIITEGELDAMAFYEAGIQNATSVPNGAQSFTKQDGAEEKAALSFLWTAKKQIDAAKRVLIATDMDDEGNKIAEELARRIGRHRCWRVRFDDKDANEQLLRRGAASLVKCVEQAEPWPVEGLYEATQYIPEVYDLFQTCLNARVETGMVPVDTLYSPQPGLLSVITGIPTSGKSTFVDQIMINQARKYGHTFAICSFENPPSVHIAKLAEMLLQKHFFESEQKAGQRMTMAELQSVMPFITKHFKFISQDDGKKATIESIIERIKTAVFRWGVNGVVIDPYNYILRPTKAENETIWIDDVLTQLKLLAQAHGIHIWFVAHPTKLPMDGEGDYQPPRGYSISGSSAWYSKPDFGLTVHRDMKRPGLVRVICWKVRFDWMGKQGEVSILYDTQTNVYLTDIIGDLPPMMAEVNRYGEEERRRYN